MARNHHNQISRRSRRAKTDRLDVERLLAQLVRYVGGERTAFRVVRVPTEADEHRRHLHRELRALISDRRARNEADTTSLPAITDHCRVLAHLEALRPAMRALRGLDVGSAPGRQRLLPPAGPAAAGG